MQDNDIILCDGPCNRAYHVRCLVPPVDPEALPEEEGWLCPACDHKVGAKLGMVVRLLGIWIWLERCCRPALSLSDLATRFGVQWQLLDYPWFIS